MACRVEVKAADSSILIKHTQDSLPGGQSSLLERRRPLFVQPFLECIRAPRGGPSPWILP